MIKNLFLAACVLAAVWFAVYGVSSLYDHWRSSHAQAPRAHVKAAGTTASKFPTLSPTVTPTTVEIVPLPADPNGSSSGIPQPSFAPAP